MSIKKTLSLILTLSIIMTSFVTVFATENGQSTEKPYNDAVTLLSALGIMEGKSETDFGENDFLTRAEMSTIAVRFIGLESKTNSNTDNIFSDVDSSHWGKYYIETAAAMEIVSGNGDGTFSPDDETTAEQAIKMLVCALGYEPKAEELGGYPTGYITTANQLDLLDGIDFSTGYDKPIERWKIAMMVYNALEAELMEVKTYGAEKEFTIAENKTALSTYHNVERRNGTVIATYQSTLENNYPGFDEVTIDDANYITSLNMSKYIGYNIDFYCRITDDSTKIEIIAFFPIQDEAERFELNFDDITKLTVTADLDVETEYYSPSTKKAKTEKANSPIIMYNGKAEKFETAEELQKFLDAHTNQGKVVFLKNDRKDINDILFVENYDAYVISNINPEFDWISYNIYTSDGIERGLLDLSTNDNAERRVFYYDADGNEIMMGDLGISDVIMVYASLDKTIYNIYQSRRKVTGRIEKTEKLDSIVAPDSQEKTYETISEIDFSNITDTKYSKNWYFASSGITKDGLEYDVDLSASGGYISESGKYYNVEGLNDDAFGGLKGKELPEISSGNVLRLTKGISDSAEPDRGGFIKIRNIFDNSQVAVGDRIKVTAWVYTDEIWDGSPQTKVDNQEDATTALNMWLWTEKGSVKNKAGYNISKWRNGEGTSVTNLKNHQWVPVSFEYNITRGNITATDIRIDSAVDGNVYPHSRNLFVAGVKVEKVTSGLSGNENFAFPEDNGRYKFYINGEGYESTSNLYSSLIPKDEEITLLLDNNNKIAGFINGRVKSAYGLLMDVGTVSNAFGDTLVLKILESDGTIQTYETLKEVKAWDGKQVSRILATSLVTNEPADPMTSHYLWSTKNEKEFEGVYHSWMTDKVKSDAASRKIIYYETNSKGQIHTVIVPSVPEDNPECKITMLHNFGWNSNPWLSYDNVTQSVSGRMISYVNGEFLDKDEYMYRIDNFATIFEAVPMNYDESDYRVVQGGITAMATENLYDGMDWSNAQLYRYPGTETIDFMVINPNKPSNGSNQHKVVIVESIGETEDGYSLEGYLDGVPYSMPIKANTRLMEHILVTSLDEDWEYVTKDMLPQMAEEGAKPYNVFYESDIMGNQETPYVSPESVFKGDVVRVFERDGEITSLEIVRRKSTGVVTMFNTTYPGTGMYSALMQWNTCVRGEIVDVDSNINTITVKGYYTTNTSPVVSINKDPRQSNVVAEFTTLLHLTNTSACVYDLKTGKCYPAQISDYQVGDEIFSWKYTSSPSNVIIFKNAD